MRRVMTLTHENDLLQVSREFFEFLLGPSEVGECTIDGGYRG